MARYAYVNGSYVPHARATVHVEDRGFQFADGVYEVVTIQDGHLVDEEGHLARLDRSLGELRIAWPMGRRALAMVMRNLIRRNGVRDGLVYLQITRGQAPRDFRFPAGVRPTLVMTTRRMSLNPAKALAEGVGVITMPDIRWKRRDIKSVALLPQVLGKQMAVGRRLRGLAGRRRRQRHRGMLVERLDRHRRRRPGHASGQQRHPQRHHPTVDPAARGGAGGRLRGAAVLGRGGPRRARGVPVQRDDLCAAGDPDRRARGR
jgi:Amino-transferase class IV